MASPRSIEDEFANVDPLRWPSHRKWAVVALVSLQGFLSPMCATILAPGAPEITSDFGLHSLYLPNLPVGIYALGLGFGPLYLAPLSEVYGRRPTYLTSFTLFLIFTLGAAFSPDIATLSVLRLLSGMCGSAGPTLGGASIGDMFPRKQRAKAQAIYSLGPTAGPFISPLIGAFIVDRTHTWRWSLWVIAIAAAILVTCCVFFLRETYGPVIRRRLYKTLKASGTEISEPEIDSIDVYAGALVKGAALRPFRLLFTSPMCALMALLMSFIYGELFLFVITIPLLYGPQSYYGLFSYRWQSGLTGLAYIPLGIGILAGLLICGNFMDKCNAAMSKRLGRREADFTGPESRMPFMAVGLAIIPIGLTVFAWTAHFQTHWIGPLIGNAIFGVGTLMVYVSVQTYVVDAFETQAASALAAVTFTRAIGSCIFSITGFQMYKSLGYAWGAMLMAFLCAAVVPIPILLYRLAPRLRRHTKA